MPLPSAPLTCRLRMAVLALLVATGSLLPAGEAALPPMTLFADRHDLPSAMAPPTLAQIQSLQFVGGTPPWRSAPSQSGEAPRATPFAVAGPGQS